MGGRIWLWILYEGFMKDAEGTMKREKAGGRKKLLKERQKKKVNRKKEEKDGPGTAKVSGSLALL